MYEIRYGSPTRDKIVKTDDYEQANRIYDKAKRFAENHRLVWTVALWDILKRGKWLIKSETVNGTIVTSQELTSR